MFSVTTVVTEMQTKVIESLPHIQAIIKNARR